MNLIPGRVGPLGPCVGGPCTGPLPHSPDVVKLIQLGSHCTGQVRIQDLVKGGAPASEAESCRHSEASNLWPGSRAWLRALEAFGFLMLKYAFSHILETLFLSFVTSILTPKVDKNRTLEFTSINLRHSYILHLFFNLHEKVML